MVGGEMHRRMLNFWCCFAASLRTKGTCWHVNYAD
jgi:hypothetical protein